MRIGFVVNPVAGMGGSVGLKGTDGAAVQKEALARGGKKLSPMRAGEALESIRSGGAVHEFLTCAGEMGELELKDLGMSYMVVYRPVARTTAKDTKEAARRFADEKVDLIVFAGGDGTARDLLEVVNGRTPILGIPSGVKMHSAVFALRPEDVGGIVNAFAADHSTKDADVLDVDEEAYRKGLLQVRLFGIAKVPDERAHMQSSKMVYHSGTADEEARELGQYIAETMETCTAYIVGPGSTTQAIARHLSQEKTVLGVDVFKDRRLIVRDADETALLQLLTETDKASIIVTPIGSQGFIFGRGNQQISSKVISKVGTDNVIIVATPSKLSGTPVLRVDTGDRPLDNALRGRRKVVTGYKRRKLVLVE
ncbi:MAG: ATP-NAD kinase family protein [Thermoplasmata archaeon]|nr:ATP-NAD kinase family protein [Thermoplasmata archaeon]